MGKVTGRLLLDLLQDGTVVTAFAANGIDGNAHPLQAKNVHYAESDLVSFFEFTPAKAKAQIAQLQEFGHVDLVISIDREKITHIFQPA